MNRTVILGVTGGIAGYKTLELVKRLRKKSIYVFVIMTEHAEKMFPPAEFVIESGNKVRVNLLEKDFDYKDILKARKVDHIDLAGKADLMVIAPATANIIAKLANGIADDLLTTTALAVTSKIIICPSMNVNMWNNPVVKNNIEKLRGLGYIIVEPATGLLACGYTGDGRLAEIDDIQKEIESQLGKSESLKGKKVIVTAGGTSEKIDEVRFITNRSGGKMGIALAEECYMRGAEVCLLRAKSSVKPRYLIREEVFTTAEDLLRLAGKYAKDGDIFFHTAAVSDFRIGDGVKGKLSSNKQVKIVLEPQIKILDQIKVINPTICLIGFKAEYYSESEKLIMAAAEKIKESGADAVVANDVSRKDRGFESDNNEVYVVFADGSVAYLPFASKKVIAEQIVNIVSDI